jgi:phage shock protein PspC (stress-responsive transcriptional regulator)
MNTTHDQQAPGRPTGDPLDRAFAWLRNLGIMRDPADRWLGGVCSGIAHRLGVDPVIVRIALIVLTFMGGIGLPAYLVAWALLPDTAGEIKAESGIRHGDGSGIVLLIAAGLSLGSVLTFDGQGWRFGWLIPLGLLAFWISRRRGLHQGWQRGYGQTEGPANAGTSVPPRPTWADGRPTDAAEGDPTGSPSFWTQVGESGPVGQDPSRPVPAPPAPARPPRQRRRKGRRSMGARGGLVVLGLAIAAYGLGRVVDGPVGFPGTADVLGRILALGVIAIGVIIAALRGRTSGFPGFVGVVLALTTAGAIANPNLHFDRNMNFGDRVVTPTDAQGSRVIQGNVGDLTLDLSKLSTTPTTAPTLDVQGGMGDVTIEVPAGLTVQLDASPRMGTVTGPDGDTIDGHTLLGSGPADVVVKVAGGMGDIKIEETR